MTSADVWPVVVSTASYFVTSMSVPFLSAEVSPIAFYSFVILGAFTDSDSSSFKSSFHASSSALKPQN